jgi:5'-nucleotidase
MNMTRKNMPLNILLTNDDGIDAQGLLALHRVLSHEHRVWVIAPDRERSAVGHGITLHQPLRVTPVSINGGARGLAVSGTPADCIKLAVLELMEQRPDLVISGINPGANVGVDMNYSGTVAAAKEAAIYGIKSMAISMQGDGTHYFDEAAKFAAHVAPMVVSNGLPVGTFLNINLPNMPPDQAAGVRVSRQAIDLYNEYFEKRRDPRNHSYYWQGNVSQPDYRHQDSDGAALFDNYITITPVRCDMTDYNALEQIKKWDFKGGSGNGDEID